MMPKESTGNAGGVLGECSGITQAHSLENLLPELARFGLVRLGQYSSTKVSGWHCKLEMFVTGQGVQIQVATGFDHATPLEAALECADRLRAALAEMSTQSTRAASLPTLEAKP